MGIDLEGITNVIIDADRVCVECEEDMLVDFTNLIVLKIMA